MLHLKRRMCHRINVIKNNDIDGLVGVELALIGNTIWLVSINS